jgi:hypothetical protein
VISNPQTHLQGRKEGRKEDRKKTIALNAKRDFKSADNTFQESTV